MAAPSPLPWIRRWTRRWTRDRSECAARTDIGCRPSHPQLAWTSRRGRLHFLQMLLPPFSWSQSWARSSAAEAKGKQGGITLRRFAGPAVYAQRMNPMRVAHVTDLHVGRVTPFAIQREAQALEDNEYTGLWSFTPAEVDSLSRWVTDKGGALITMTGYGSQSTEVTPLNQKSV